MVFHTRPGNIRDLVEMMKQATQAEPNRPRILTDLSGPMNTMVMEMRHESLAAAEQFRTELFRSQSFHAGQDHMQEWFVSGENELYTIEQEVTSTHSIASRSNNARDAVSTQLLVVRQSSTAATAVRSTACSAAFSNSHS